MGSGLKPLRGSTVLQQIHFEEYSAKCKISCASVIPILDSIISKGRESQQGGGVRITATATTAKLEEWEEPIDKEFYWEV